MTLIAMAVYDTEENKRTQYTRATIDCLLKTVDRDKHRIVIVDNGSCQATQQLYHEYIDKSVDEGKANPTTIMFMHENVGTAKAINQAWKLRQPGQHCIKMDNDILIHSSGWVEEMEQAIEADPNIGQVGLKRKDCWEWPGHPGDDWRSTLHMLPHIPGHPWRIVEKVKHVIGSCVMHSSALLDKVGYLYQPSLYGYDDVIMSHRTHLAGFYSCFLPHINIDHIDDGLTPYQDWKQKHSGEQTQAVISLVHEMYNGTKPIYYGPQD
jgi:GT2 family glycosyltransferase